MISFEPLSERHRIAVIDIYNHFVETTIFAYSQEKVESDFKEL